MLFYEEESVDFRKSDGSINMKFFMLRNDLVGSADIESYNHEVTRRSYHVHVARVIHDALYSF